jgi:hypothetical protein
MPKRSPVAVPRTRDAFGLEFVSYGRKAPGQVSRLNAEQVAQVARTVSKVPEVVVKVSGGARDAGGARAHFAYLDRHGALGVELDDGQALQGKTVAAALIEDWNLDLSRGQYRPPATQGQKDTRPKVVHNIVLSMPAQVPPQAVLSAARKFAVENFALQYRYAMVLHTDQAHPHVHLVVKAEHEYEPGKRLYIRKATLQAWREQFAHYLREQGVAANASSRALRGLARTAKRDAIYQRLKSIADYERLPAAQRAQRKKPKPSTFMNNRVAGIGRELQTGALSPDPGKAKLLETRRAVRADWIATARVLQKQGEVALAREVERFVKDLPAVRTEKEQIAAQLVAEIVRGRNQEVVGRTR